MRGLYLLRKGKDSSIVLIFFLSFIGCAKPFQPPPYPYEYWYKKGSRIEEIQDAMLKCDYPIYYSPPRNSEWNEMAKRHICMEKKGFTYKGEYGTYCTRHPNLPACIEARAEKMQSEKR